MPFSLGLRSKARLVGVHPDLVAVVERAIKLTSVDFTVVEGLRSVDRQRELVKVGASKTMHSRHIHGYAVDLAPYIGGKVRWDWPPFHDIAAAMKAASKELDIPIEWGGDWKTFKDGPHFQLPHKQYPDP